MRLHRLHADSGKFGDLLVAVALGHELHDLALARVEVSLRDLRLALPGDLIEQKLRDLALKKRAMARQRIDC